MAKIYQLDGSTLYLCNSCLDDLGPIPGKWEETPLETCSVCGEVDLQSREEIDRYHARPTNQFGEFAFEHVCLDFLPDIVCDIRDFWMLDFVERSPFRRLFKWCIMPTVDARPQARQWMATYQSADACFSYSDWAGCVLQDQSGDQIKYLGSAPPSAHPAYQPVEDRDKHKAELGLDPDYKIIGTVM